MAQNVLRLNDQKTEILISGPPDLLTSLTSDLGPQGNHNKTSVKNLVVILDNSLTFEKQIKAVVRASFLRLRGLTKVKPFLSSYDFGKVIHAFISSWLDYCNSLYSGVSQFLLSRLQLVQNASAQLLFIFKCLHGLAPSYLCDLLTVHAPTRAQWSTDQMLLDVPWSRLRLRGDRAFIVAGLKLWNSLPLHIRTSPTLDIFKSCLKTYFYSLAF